MTELSLEQGEQLIISSHAQFGELKFFSQLKTGDAFLTDRRFVFMGRLQVRTMGHLAAVAAGKGKRHFEVPVSALINAKKRKLESSIEVVYKKGSKEKKFLLKPERIRYLGSVLGLGIGVAGGEIGQMLGDSLLDRTGELVGSRVGEKLGEEAGGLAGEKMEEFHAKSLVKAWAKAFEYVILQKRTSEPLHDEVPAERVQKVQEVPLFEEIPPSVFVEPEVARPEEDQEFTIFEGDYSSDALVAPEMTPTEHVQKVPHFEEIPPSALTKPEVARPEEDQEFTIPHHDMETVAIEEIFEEELGRDFLDFKVPVDKEDYLVQLIMKIKETDDYTERMKFSQELRKCLRQLKGE